MALSMALDLIGGEVFNLLSGSVTRAVDRKVAFRDLLQDMKWTLKSLKSQARVIQQIQEHNLELSLPNDEIIALVAKMTNGRQLVDRLSGFRFRLWNFCCTNDCADQLRELNRSLESLFDNLHLEHLRDGKENLILSRKNHDDLHEVKATLKTIVQKIDDLEVKGLLNKLQEQNGRHSMKASTSASGSNTEHEGHGEGQASSLEGLVEAAFLMLFEVVVEVRDRTMMFRPFLRHLKSTLDFLKPFIEEIAEHNKVLDRPKEELESLRIHMMKGVLLVRKCSNVRLWTCSNKKYKYTNQLFELDESLQWQLSIFTEQVARDVRETSNLITNIQEVLKQIEGSGILQNQSEFKGSSDLTESPTPTVELDMLNLQGTRGVMKETLFSAGVKEIEGSDEVPGLAVPQMPTVRFEVQYPEGRNKMSPSSARDTKEHEITEDASPTLESDVQNVQETRDEMKTSDSAIDIEERLKGIEGSELAEDLYEVKGQEGEKLSLTEIASLNEFMALKRSEDVNLRNKIIEQIEVLAQKGTRDVNLQNKITEQIECLPYLIGKLSSFLTVDLSENGILVLPFNIGGLSSLTRLDLHSNRITELPDTIGDLLSLVYLDLSRNILTCLPSTFGRLVHLEELNLSSNELFSLPDSIGSFVNLKKLHVDSNNIVEIPHSIGHCSSLRELHADFNRLKALPEAIGKIEGLEILSVRYNNIKMLPTTVSSLPGLKELDVSFNELESVPENLCFATSLVKMNIGNNFADLQSLPRAIGNLEMLEELDISNNQIRCLPNSFRMLTRLRVLRIEDTPLELPPRHVAEKGAQAVVQYMAELVEKVDAQTAKQKKGWAQIFFSRSSKRKSNPYVKA